MSSTMTQAREVLRRHFGYDDFRSGQVDVVAAVLGGADTLGVLPTGGGKSVCYQVPALLLPRLTIVISPLISLMKDQVDRLGDRGIHATLLNSTLDGAEVSRRLLRVARGDIKLLYLAPERFAAADLREPLQRCGVSLIAVDEAHCISEWGHEFRPSFRRIADVSAAYGSPQLIALTATATPVVRRDIVRQLRMRAPRVIVGGFDRTNLHYSVRRSRGDADKRRALLTTLRSHERPAVVYASTRATVARVAQLLNRARCRAAPYHAGLDDKVRTETQEAFMRGRLEAIVATNAFGMGIDKPDVRLVVHYAMPGTLEAYYQEAGRAGRDGLPAHCVLLHADDDRLTHEWFIRGTFPERPIVERVYATLLATHDGGRVAAAGDANGASAMRFLLHHGALVERRPPGTHVRIRLYASPARIRRELTEPADAIELDVLRALWRRDRAAVQWAATVDLDELRPGISGRMARAALERLRRRRLLDFGAADGWLELARPTATLDSFGIDWNAIARRRSAELEKLDMMQRYARARSCRRAFALRYFGEHCQAACAACDNCQRRWHHLLGDCVNGLANRVVELMDPSQGRA